MREFSSKTEITRPDENLLEGVSFTLDGDEFHCYGGGSMLRVSEAARRARGGDQAAELSMLAESFLLMLGQEEYDRFATHIDTHGTPDEVVTEIGEWLNEQAKTKVAEQTGRPTRRRPSSPDGPQDRGERISRVISLQTGEVRVAPEPQDHKPKTGRRATG